MNISEAQAYVIELTKAEAEQLYHELNGIDWETNDKLTQAIYDGLNEIFG